MIRKITLVTLFLYGITANSQDFTGLWQGYFSYFNASSITQGNGKIYAAAQNAIFSFDVNTNEIKTITTVNGLSGQDISTLSYSEEFELLLVGYENGLIEVVFNNEDDILSVVDIVEKVTISPDLKRINHFNEFEGLVYISTDFGISIYDLARLEFGDTYFIGNGGAQISIKQTAIFNNAIYAACGDNNAIKIGQLDNPNLIDSNQWQTIGSGNYSGIATVENNIYTVNTSRTLFQINGNNLQQRANYPNQPVDLRSVMGQLLVTTAKNVYAYDSNLNLANTIGVIQDFETNYNGTSVIEGEYFIATDDFGLLRIDNKSANGITEVRPEGPLRNDGFKLASQNNQVWMSYGDYTVSYNPSPLRRYGFSHLVDEEWTNIPFDSLLGATNLNYISVNPFDRSQVFVSSFQEGILEINNDVATTLFNESNSGLESLIVPGNPGARGIRVAGTTFDRTGLLWSVSSRIDEPLKSYDLQSGQWQSYSFSEIIEDPLNDELGFGDIVIDRNGTKWIGSFFSGVIGYNENNPSIKIRNINTEEQGLESSVVPALAIDNRDQLWIGTIRGLRVLFNTSSFFEDPDPQARPIIFEDEGIAKELLDNQFITDIKVDGSNNKWVGTLDSGVFYFSPDGQETIYHFTTDNSPLPTNFINDISIDFQSGKVYFATASGLVSFLSGGSDVSDELVDAYVYPNPVRPEYDILGSNNLNDINLGVKVKGLTGSVNIKITDIEGNLVAEAQSGVNTRSSSNNYNFAIDGGTAIWNGKNLANNVVSSGVYLFMISDLESFETKVLKLVIIRR